MKVCIIGNYGHIGYALNGIRNDDSMRLAAIAPGPEKNDIKHLVEIASKMEPAPVYFSNYVEMFEKIKPDIAVVACQFSNHAIVSAEALKRNIHVFSEKPVATKFEDLYALQEVYERSEANLGAMFGIRFTPHFHTAKKAVDEGTIGQIRLMNAQKSYKLGQRNEIYKKRETFGGIIPWVGSHAIDWLIWFSGEEFKSVYASHSTKFNNGHEELETSALCNFVMSNDIFASVSIDYLRPQNALTHDDDRIRVVGSKGIIEVYKGKVYLTNDLHQDWEMPLENCGLVFNDFTKRILSGKKDSSLANDAFYVTKACLNARLSADTNEIIQF